jgi:hypothetical protein
MQSARRRGAKSKGLFEEKRRTVTVRVTDETRARLERAASESGRSLAQEIELRLDRSLDRQGALDEAFGMTYGNRAGLVRFIGLVIRHGGGSRALIEALRRLDVPDVTTEPEALAQRLIWDAGYDDKRDKTMAARAAATREGLGPEMPALLVDAYHRLRAEIDAAPSRELPKPDPRIQALWDRAFERAEERRKGEG